MGIFTCSCTAPASFHTASFAFHESNDRAKMLFEYSLSRKRLLTKVVTKVIALCIDVFKIIMAHVIVYKRMAPTCQMYCLRFIFNIHRKSDFNELSTVKLNDLRNFHIILLLHS